MLAFTLRDYSVVQRRSINQVCIVWYCGVYLGQPCEGVLGLLHTHFGERPSENWHHIFFQVRLDFQSFSRVGHSLCHSVFCDDTPARLSLQSSFPLIFDGPFDFLSESV